MVQEESASQEDDVEVQQQDFHAALASLTPSLSKEELARYEALREQYQGH